MALAVDADRERRKAEREAEREAMWADSQTRMPRVVRLTANEARTLDPDPMRPQHTTFQCGHLPAFWEWARAMRRCVVVDCTAEVWDMDYEERERREQAELDALYRDLASARRWQWIGGLLMLVLGLATGWMWFAR